MNWDICASLVLLAIVGLFTSATALQSKFGCAGELVLVDCDSSGVIEIVRANYGRLDSNICSSSTSSSLSCLHRSSKAVLDRICGGKSSCTVRASDSVFQSSDCPQVEKYLEVHFRCVRGEEVGGRRDHHLPPWLEDLSATFSPVSVSRATPSPSSSSSSTTSTSSYTSLSPSTSRTISDRIRDNDNDDEHQDIITSENPVENPTHSGGNKGRYFLIPEHTDQEEGGERKEDSSHTTLVITVTISAVSTLLSILIIIHLCRKYRGKRLEPEEREDNCYQCQADIPAQNIIYTPVSAREPTEYHQYRSLPFHINKIDNTMRRSTTESSAIYGYQNKTDDNCIYHFNNGPDGIYQSNNEPDGIYHIPVIDSNNYIMHTKLYGDQGDIKILSQSKSFHPVQSIPSVQPNISLPDLSEATSLRRTGNSDHKIQRMMTLSSRPPEVLERMSPIQILFNESGQYFVNFNMDNQNK